MPNYNLVILTDYLKLTVNLVIYYNLHYNYWSVENTMSNNSSIILYNHHLILTQNHILIIQMSQILKFHHARIINLQLSMLVIYLHHFYHRFHFISFIHIIIIN